MYYMVEQSANVTAYVRKQTAALLNHGQTIRHFILPVGDRLKRDPQVFTQWREVEVKKPQSSRLVLEGVDLFVLD